MRAERWIEGAIDRRASIAWSTDHRITIKTRAEIQSVITVVMRSGGAHPDRPIAIQGAKSERFYNAYRAMNLRSDDRDISENGPSWTVYPNRRSFRSDGYEISPYKKACSLRS